MKKDELNLPLNKLKSRIDFYFNFIILTKLKNLKCRIWNKHLLLWYYKLWIREDEFHISLSMDTDAMRVMNDKEMGEYLDNLTRRRRRAHLRDD